MYGPDKLHHAHAINEQLSVEQLVQYTKAITTFIYEWSHTTK